MNEQRRRASKSGAAAMWPGLTTCRQPIAQMTEAIVAALIRPGDNPAGSKWFSHEIVVRGSTGAPGATPRNEV